jgi:hypothetical protein
MWYLRVDSNLNPEMRAARYWQIALQQFAFAYFMVGTTFVVLLNGWFGWLPILGLGAADGFLVSGVISVLTLAAAQWAEKNLKGVFEATGGFSDLVVMQIAAEIRGVLMILRLLMFVLWPVTVLASCLGALMR